MRFCCTANMERSFFQNLDKLACSTRARLPPLDFLSQKNNDSWWPCRKWQFQDPSRSTNDGCTKPGLQLHSVLLHLFPNLELTRATIASAIRSNIAKCKGDFGNPHAEFWRMTFKRLSFLILLALAGLSAGLAAQKQPAARESSTVVWKQPPGAPADFAGAEVCGECN